MVTLGRNSLILAIIHLENSTFFIFLLLNSILHCECFPLENYIFFIFLLLKSVLHCLRHAPLSLSHEIGAVML